LVFVCKHNERCEIICYKVYLDAQGFIQKFGIDYDSINSLVMDSITFQYLLGMAVHIILKMRLMDVVSAYLYGSLNAQIYKKFHLVSKRQLILHWFRANIMASNFNKYYMVLNNLDTCSINDYDIFFIEHHFINDPLLPYFFMKWDTYGFVIIAIYIDDLNLVSTKFAYTIATQFLIHEFEMKLFGKTTFCICL